MTTASSTSQSSLAEPGARISASLGPAASAGVLVEHDGLRRDWRVGFRRVIRVVEADANQVRDAAHARAQPDALRCSRQCGEVDLAQAGQRCWRQRTGIDVRYHAREVAHDPLRIDHPRLLTAASTEADELHLFVSFEK